MRPTHAQRLETQRNDLHRPAPRELPLQDAPSTYTVDPGPPSSDKVTVRSYLQIRVDQESHSSCRS